MILLSPVETDPERVRARSNILVHTLAPALIERLELDEDIVHAVVKTIDKHEQGTASGSWSWNNSI